MDDTTILILFLGMLAVFCVGIVVIGGIMLGGFALLAGRTAKAFGYRPEITSTAYLDQQTRLLRPWQPGALGDLSNRWDGWWRRVGNSGYSHGLLRSLSQPDTAWAVFLLERHTFRSGVLQLRISARTVALTIQGGGQFDQNATVEALVDGQPAGRVTLPGGEWFDAQGQPVGRYARRVAMKLRDVAYQPVIVGGRTLGEITDIWIRQPNATRQPFPALRNVAADLSAGEEAWLLIALGVELYYDALWERRYD
jgi:hypothetical protein